MAAFSLSVHLVRPSTNSFLTHLGPKYNRAVALVYTTLTSLVTDSQRLVAKAVTDACRMGLQSQDEKDQHAARAKLELLVKWQKLEEPFSWGSQGSKETYQTLVQLLQSPDDNETNPLKESSQDMTYVQLATHLVEWGLRYAEKEPEIKAPLVKNGICSMSLRMTAPLTLAMLGSKHETINIWSATLEKLKICFLPWRRNGGNAYLTTHTSWLYIQKSTMMMNPNRKPEAAQEIAIAAANQDRSAPWKVPQLIGQMGPFWEKNVLPDEWDIKNATLTNHEDHRYVSQTYEWVRDNFDGAKTTHRLGIVLAIMVSALLPNINWDKNLPNTLLTPNMTTVELTKKLRDELPWIKGTHKGISDKRPYITMMSTAIISLLESDSPLRKYVDDKKSLGSPWTDKHSECKISKIFKFDMDTSWQPPNTFRR
jgi:hypothetical protein